MVQSQALPLLILRTAHHHDRISIGDVVREFGVSRSAAYRALCTLVDNEFLLLSPSGRGYGAGPALLRMAEIGAIDHAAKKRWGPALGALRDATGETVHAAVLVGGQVLVVDGRRSTQEFDMGSRIGMTAPASSMAAGKLLLAALDDRNLRDITQSQELLQRTNRSIAEVDELLKEITQIRQDGYALAIQESEAGIDSIAIPLDGETIRSRVAAVISLQSERGGARTLRKIGRIAENVLAGFSAEGGIAAWKLGPNGAKLLREPPQSS